MKAPRVPGFLVGGVANLPDLLLAIARDRGLPRERAEEVLTLLPPAVRDAPCFLDRLSGIWRYDFGHPFDNVGGNAVVLGTPMFQPVKILFDVVLCAARRLPTTQLRDYLVRLGDPGKHGDLLVEFAPILRLPSHTSVQYEAQGYGPGGTSIDWLLATTGSPSVLLEVKNRSRDLVEQLTRIQSGDLAPDGTAPVPMHDTALVFRSLESKFNPHKPCDLLQGAWVKTDLRQEESELQEAFRALDPERVHFAVLGDWEADVYILTREASVKAAIADALLVRESRRFVFNRLEG